MAHSSPTGRDPLSSPPERRLLSTFLHEGRNNELSHRDALLAAQAQHDRVRQAAIRVYELHELREEHQRILDLEKKEQERLRAEAAIVAEEKRLRELRAKTVPQLSPEPAPVPLVRNLSTPAIGNTTTTATAGGFLPKSASSGPAATPQINGLFSNQNKIPTTIGSSGTAAPQNSLSSPSNGTVQLSKQPAQPAARAVSAPQAPAAQPKSGALSSAQGQLVERYSEIHRELKQLRKVLQAESKEAGSPLKGKMGTYRREIRVAIGQLTSGKGANAQPITKITTALKEALDGQVPSRPIDVGRFVVRPRQPVEGVPNNDATMPSLFIYLMNICAKGIINQFVNECGANPKAADPIGVFAAHVFSHKEFQWRGESLIDILMAKFRIVCPVLFGLRGSDKTERGRQNLGWRKDGPGWITEQSHNDRMTGLGAGYSSISLRDFSKTSKSNPYPPTNYWRALAGIVNTPMGETSNTQYVVLRAMIEGYEQRFLGFYGNSAIAALRLALIEFPKRAPTNSTAAQSLQAMADIFRADGLVLT